MKVNRYRIEKAIICYNHSRKNGTSIYWSLRLASWWFRLAEFEGDKDSVTIISL